MAYGSLTHPEALACNHGGLITQMTINEEQIITSYPTDGAMSSSRGGRVWELSVVCLHNNAIVARGILCCIVGHPKPHLGAIYIVSSVGT